MIFFGYLVNYTSFTLYTRKTFVIKYIIKHLTTNIKVCKSNSHFQKLKLKYLVSLKTLFKQRNFES